MRNVCQFLPEVLFWNNWRKKLKGTGWPRFIWKKAVETGGGGDVECNKNGDPMWVRGCK